MNTTNDPKTLGFWARCVRDAQHLSQEALAANASVDIRTVQRFEAGKTVNITSRRALAKALGYDNPDVFDDPKFAEEVLKFFDGLKAIQQKSLDDQHPDSVRVKAQGLTSGTEAMRFADVVNAMSFVIDDGLSDAAKEVAAGFCDYVQELMDLDDFPMSGRLGIAKDLDDLLQDLREKGAHAYFATRDRKLRGPDWGDKPSWDVTIGFLVVVPTDRQLTELYIPRKSKFA
ncbi:helix-turn-helix transcriptional regulator [Bradyrhizobium sp. INPA01-394B]|uniref:Helix-turn-helix transcriptional regulator n=1 Tax=Bradyrhizobium campsiandrae TaxID=1729892 RepID=A0ABR7UJW1_9BRAD|nr:helix-turn-helix transcriptional regulator [Bradyrhizobium campsiandrae]MBC9883710.1 helix-turn-helix transcriptional regulator [Bradyrhizobium campsiandrae]MBC9984398.1 helix-turn-helix transcriptional regulator [Bradyrhizobium campsiandrae]